MYNAIIVKPKSIRVHSNADRLKLATCVGNQIIVGLNTTEDMLGIYFGCDGQLSHEFCHHNNLYRDKTMNSNPKANPGMFDKNRRVRAQKFRGEISDGFWIPIDSLNYLGKANIPAEGEEFDSIDGNPICNKYINQKTLDAQQNQGKKNRSAKSSVMFKEHIDTEHFARHVFEVKNTDTAIVTVKLHGTSARIGNVLVEKTLSRFEKVLKWFGLPIAQYEWKYLNGTRRVVLGEAKDQNSFHDPSIREKAMEQFKGLLRKGETVYFEIVGYEPSGTSIMPIVDTTKLNDSDFTSKYSNFGDGSHMVFSYGCKPGECDFYVYRMTMNNEDGQTLDYHWDDVVARCNEMGVKHVKELDRFSTQEFKLRHNITDDRDLDDKLVEYIDQLSDGADHVDPSHYSEGVCVKLEGGLRPRIFKHKNFNFKVLEGIIKDSGVVDAEEAQG